MRNKKIIWTFLEDETQQAFYDLLGKLSDTDKAEVENRVLSKICQKGKPVVGVTEVRFGPDKFSVVGTFGECSFDNSIFDSDTVL